MKVESSHSQNASATSRANRAESRAGVAKSGKHAVADGPDKSERIRKGGLREVEKGLLRDDRYDYKFSKDDLSIYDRQTNTYVRNWGDPHVHTGDDDKLGFHDNNLTYDLPNGTKVTLKPTEKDANGVAFIDSVAISAKRRGVVIEGVHSAAGPQRGRFSGSDEVDGQFDDGITLTAPNEVDDLYLNGVELKGHDGKGGDIDLDDRFASMGAAPGQGVDDADAAGGDFRTVLGGLLDDNQKSIDGLLEKLKNEKDPNQRFLLQQDIQQAYQDKSELRGLLTRLLQLEHEARMQVINALPTGR